MTRVLATLGVIVAMAALGVLAAEAQPPSGIARPSNEAALSDTQLGAALFAANCSTCHGDHGQGRTTRGRRTGVGNVQGLGPSLEGVGAQAADFYLRTGYMPLGHPDEQPGRARVQFREREIRALVAYVASFKGGPAVPMPHPEQGSISQGQELFTSHCAGCHQIVGQGGVVSGARVPPLQQATATQIAEAVRIGPYLMPRFSPHDISDAELNSIVRYVLSTRHPDDRGGWGIGNLGPFPEGMVTWLIAAVALVGLCMVIGKRLGSS